MAGCPWPTVCCPQCSCIMFLHLVIWAVLWELLQTHGSKFSWMHVGLDPLIAFKIGTKAGMSNSFGLWGRWFAWCWPTGWASSTDQPHILDLERAPYAAWSCCRAVQHGPRVCHKATLRLYCLQSLLHPSGTWARTGALWDPQAAPGVDKALWALSGLRAVCLKSQN